MWLPRSLAACAPRTCRCRTCWTFALSETVIEGIQTNIPLHRELMVDAKFIEGGTSIHYLEEWMSGRKR